MNIPYIIFVQACAAGIICAIIFVVRLIITHVFNGRKQWSNRPYWWVVSLAVVIVVAKLVGVSAGNQMTQNHNRPHKAQQNAAALVDYDVLYDYCVKNVGAFQVQTIKKTSGIDFCACVAEETIGNITIKASDETMLKAAQAAAAKCENMVDKALSKKGL